MDSHKFQNKYATLAKYSLVQDIELWKNAVPDGTFIKYHIQQFDEFFKRSLTKMTDEYIDKKFVKKNDLKVLSLKKGLNSRTNRESTQMELLDDETFKFITVVTGVISSKWNLLRQVAQQRLENSPYSAQLGKMDQLIGTYYSNLRNAFPDEIQKNISEIQPIAYFGHLPQLNLFNHDAPGIISIPWGAMHEGEDSISQLAIPHEVAHSVFVQLPDFLPELESKIELMADDNRQSRLLHKLISSWANEIVADLVGTALAGLKFADSAIRLAAVSNSLAGSAAAVEHPPTLIRPRIHLKALNYLEKVANINKADLENLEKQYNIVAGDQCDNFFTGVSGLTLIKCADVGNALVNVVTKILNTKLASLKDTSLGELLIRCVQNDWQIVPRETLANEIKRLRKWRTIELLTSADPVVLDLPNTPDLDYALPIASINEGCCKTPFYRCFCSECNQCP
jgi:hypothetical protein